VNPSQGRDQPAASSFNAFGSIVAGPVAPGHNDERAALNIALVEKTIPPGKKQARPACPIVNTRRLPCPPPAASHGRADGFTSVELHNPARVGKTPAAHRKKRVSMARQKRVVHSFGALTLASGPLPTPFAFAGNGRPSTPVASPRAPKDSSATATESIRADTMPQTMHLHNSAKVYDIDAAAQTSPGRVCAPQLATERSASIPAPARTLTHSTSRQDLGTEMAILENENENTRTPQSHTQLDSYATRVYFHTRSNPDHHSEFQPSYDKTIFWPHYG
jgi:hypothetical protein